MRTAGWILTVVLCGAGTPAWTDDAKDEAKAIADELKNPSPDTRLAALERAAKLGTPEALDLASQAYAHDPLPKVMVKGAWAITQIHIAQEAKGAVDARWKAAWDKVADILRKGMLDHRDDPDITLATIRAMAQMADPAFVKVLANDLWKIKDAKVIHGRLLALGCIRDKTSIDELMDILYIAPRESIAVYAGSLRWALKQLTGREFSDRIEAKKWWKENREKFEFEAVDPRKKELTRKVFDKAWDNALGDSGGK